MLLPHLISLQVPCNLKVPLTVLFQYMGSPKGKKKKLYLLWFKCVLYLMKSVLLLTITILFGALQVSEGQVRDRVRDGVRDRTRNV